MNNLVLANIAHRPMRTVVSVLGTAIGVLLIVFTVGLAHGMLHEHGRRDANINAEIMVRASGTIGLGGNDPWVLPVSHAQELAAIADVRAAVPVGQALDKSDGGFGMRFIDGIPFDEYAALSHIQIHEGVKLTGGDQIIVDPIWIRERKAQLGSTLQLFERSFTVVGIYDPPGGARVKMPLATMQEQFSGAGHATAILVGCVDPNQQDAVAQRIKVKFPDDQLIMTRDLPELYASGIPALNVFLKVVIGVAASISMLVILLAMYTTVTERTRQIGVLKSLGMSKSKIAWVIEQEAIIVSVLGVITGILFTLGARFVIMRITTLRVELEARWIVIAFLVGIGGGTIGALYPAIRAARQDAVAALGYE
ncbi:MAG TPA: FtsX-like permease family protein [Pyrinomonadaceae bacterium]|nr:FtsX-like permease family protein [Pyrinomonadaceae bacterium]